MHLLAAANLLYAQARDSPYVPDAKGAWLAEAPEQLGWSTAALEEAVAYAAREKSTALVIVHDGRLVLERYWKRDDVPRIATTHEGWPIEDVQSLQKSFISLLVGIAVDRGLMEREAAVSVYLGEGWSRGPADVERRITINHLLSMTSGLNDNLESVAPVGSRWYYNTPAYSQLIRVLGRVTEKDANEYSAEWLTTALGMADTRWITRQTAAPNPYGLATSARDMARIGLLVLRRGTWAGRRVVSEEYLADALHSSQSLNPTYGLLWWVNGQAAWRRTAQAVDAFYSVPAAPSDLVVGLGDGDRKIYVVPSLRLVVVRFGASVEPSRRFDREIWDRLAVAVR